MDNLQKLVNRAEEVLEDQGLAAKWIERPNRALNEKKPIELSKTDAGLSEVLQLLGRIEHGVFS